MNIQYNRWNNCKNKDKNIAYVHIPKMAGKYVEQY